MVFHRPSSRPLQHPMYPRHHTPNPQAMASRVGCRPLKSTLKETDVPNCYPNHGRSPAKPRRAQSACPKPIPQRRLVGLVVREWRQPITHLPSRSIMTNSVSNSFFPPFTAKFTSTDHGQNKSTTHKPISLTTTMTAPSMPHTSRASRHSRCPRALT
jgi:hypothetical protein